MAKKKPSKSSKASSPAPAIRKPVAETMARANSSKTEKKATASEPAAGARAAFSGIAIGHAAGEVWEFLSSGDPRTIAEIKKSVQAPADIVMAAIGWLAREDKLDYTTSGRTAKISLR